MKEEFVVYLRTVGLTDVIIDRIEVIYNFYQNIVMKELQEEILDIFVTDYIHKDASRQYENLWFFSKNYIMEAKSFIMQEDLDICPLAKEIKYLEIKKESYDFIKANEKSRFYLSYGLETRASGSLRASKENCDYLRDIYIKYMLPNLALKAISSL